MDMFTRPPPLPWEALPPGWGPAKVDDETMVYRQNGEGIELVADQTEPEQVHPGLRLGQCWKLRYRYTVGEQSACKSIGCVSTRQAALEGMLECMHRIHERIEESAEPHEVCAVLEGVPLGSVVPHSEENEVSRQ